MIHRSQLFNSNDGSRSNRRLRTTNCLATLVLSSSLSSITTTTAAALVPAVKEHSSSSSHGTFDNKNYYHPNSKQRLRQSSSTTKAVRSEEKLQAHHRSLFNQVVQSKKKSSQQQPATLDYPRVANNAKRRRRRLKADDNLQQQQQQQQQLQVLKTITTNNSSNNTSSYEYVSGVMFDSKARKDSNIVLHSLVLYTTPPTPTPTIANNVTNTTIIVKLYIRHGSYVGYENDITAGSGWTRQHVKITSIGTATTNTNEITVAFVEPVYIRKKQIVAFYITTTAATSSNRDNVEKDENESMIQVTTITDKHDSRMMEGEPYSWNTDLIVNVGIGISSSSSSSSSLVNSSPRSSNDDACVWNGELLYYTVNDDDMPTTETPTNQPTISPPTIFIQDLATKESRASNNNNDDDDNDNQFSSFRLRLYWEVGYYWQETYDETYWCMECGGDNTSCTLGNEIYIEWCADGSSGNNNSQQWLLVGNAASSTIRPVVDTNLCITVMGYDEGNPLRLYNCNDNDDDANNTNQLFSIVGLPSTAASTTRNNDNDDHDDDKFEIKPINNNNLCISQMHHPKKMERLYPEDCISAHNDDTGYWITF
jgi:hypothetical protein